MKTFIALALIIIFSCDIAWADCQWSTIKQLPDGNYEYSAQLNLCVGQLVQDSKVKDQQIADLNKAIQLKDLALTASDSRVALWEKTSDDELSRLNTIQSDQHRSDFLYFGLGALTVIGAGFMAAKLIKN